MVRCGGIIKRYCCIGSLALSGAMTIYEAEGGNLDPNKKVPWKFTGTTTTQSSCVDIDCGECGDAVFSLNIEHGSDSVCNDYPHASTQGGGGVPQIPGFSCGGAGKGFSFEWLQIDKWEKRVHPDHLRDSPPNFGLRVVTESTFAIEMMQFNVLDCCDDPNCLQALPKVREITEEGSIPFGPSSAFHKKAPSGGNKGWNHNGPGGWTYENREGPAAAAAFSVLMEKLLEETEFDECCSGSRFGVR